MSLLAHKLLDSTAALSREAKKFKRLLTMDDKGNVAMIFAIVALPLFAVVGAAIDYVGAERDRGAMQAVVDGASVVGAKISVNSSDAEVEKAIKNYLKANLPEEFKSLPFEYIISTDRRTVSVRMASSHETTFLRVLGYENIEYTVFSEAIGGLNRAEVVLALDFTGSMGANVVALKDGAKELLDIVYEGKETSPNVYTAVVPYVASVNIGDSARSRSWVDEQAQAKFHGDNFLEVPYAVTCLPVALPPPDPCPPGMIDDGTEACAYPPPYVPPPYTPPTYSPPYTPPTYSPPYTPPTYSPPYTPPTYSPPYTPPTYSPPYTPPPYTPPPYTPPPYTPPPYVPPAPPPYHKEVGGYAVPEMVIPAPMLQKNAQLKPSGPSYESLNSKIATLTPQIIEASPVKHALADESIPKYKSVYENKRSQQAALTFKKTSNQLYLTVDSLMSALGPRKAWAQSMRPSTPIVATPGANLSPIVDAKSKSAWTTLPPQETYQECSYTLEKRFPGSRFWTLNYPNQGQTFQKWTPGPVNHFALYNAMNVKWKGCVEARPKPYDTTDTAPDKGNPDTLFVPYLWPDEPSNGQYGDGNVAPEERWTTNQYFYNAEELNGLSPSNAGNVQWNSSQYSQGETPESYQAKLRMSWIWKYQQSPHLNSSYSVDQNPNAACPDEVVPLNNSRVDTQGKIDLMRIYNGGGTNILEGLAWAWRVVSPDSTYKLGRPYEDKSARKFIVLMTDGKHEFGIEGDAYMKTEYTAVGYADRRHLDGSNNPKQMPAILDNRFAELCNNVKTVGDPKNPITIYTVMFDPNRNLPLSTQSLFNACASSNERGRKNYYLASDRESLRQAFRDIASDISATRITK